MSVCTRCGAEFGCGMADAAAGAAADGVTQPCWCTTLPAAVPVPSAALGCWCPACLRAQLAQLQAGQAPPG